MAKATKPVKKVEVAQPDPTVEFQNFDPESDADILKKMDEQEAKDSVKAKQAFQMPKDLPAREFKPQQIVKWYDPKSKQNSSNTYAMFLVEQKHSGGRLILQ